MNIEWRHSRPPAIGNSDQYPEAIAYLNGKKWKIVVAAQQYPGMTFRTRGFGDIASGIRELRLVQRLLPYAEFSFVFEHYAANDYELSKLKKTAECPEVKSYILFGLKDEPYYEMSPEQLSWEHQEAEVINLLDSADLIIHAPCGYITPVINSFDKYAAKSLGFYEYDCQTGKPDCEKFSGIKVLDMGFSVNRLYLNGVAEDAREFTDPMLVRHCLNPNSGSSPASGRQPFYFAYGNSYDLLARALKVIMLAEGDNDRELVLVTSIKFDPTVIEQCSERIIKASCPYRSIKLCAVSTDDNVPEEQEIFSNPDGQSDKRVTLITAESLSNSDFYLLQKGTILNFSCGDISTSDAIALGKIPIMNPDKKPDLVDPFHDRLKEFMWMPGNLEYFFLVQAWFEATVSFADQLQDPFHYLIARGVKSLQQLTSPKWKDFEQKFTNWLKKINQTDALISREIAAILKPEQLLTRTPEPAPNVQAQLHQTSDSSVNVTNKKELPDINSLSVSEDNNCQANCGEKPLKQTDNPSTATTLPGRLSFQGRHKARISRILRSKL